MKKIIAAIVAIIFVDQLTKGYLLNLVARGWFWFGNAFELVPHPFRMWRINSWFNIVFTWNPGTAFSFFRGTSSLVLIFVTGAIIGYLSYLLFAKTKDKTEQWALALIVGGALGNLIDRIRFGAVIDFIDWHYRGFHWPSFNVADIAICLGVGLYILHFWQQRKGK